MGLTIEVYKGTYGDFTNGGVSGHYNQLTVVNIDGPSEPTADRPPVALVAGNVPGITKIVPVENVAPGQEPDWQEIRPEGRVGPMFGGNYGATSDGRFDAAVEKITGFRFDGAVAIHDRYETVAQYASYD